MAVNFKHLRKRNGVYQYERRVPLAVRRDDRRFAEAFASRPLFRCSLWSKCDMQIHDAWRAAHQEFERRLLIGKTETTPKLTIVTRQCERAVTDGDLVAITSRYKQITAEPFERLHRVADVDPAANAELERMTYNLGIDAAEVRRALREKHDDKPAEFLRPIDEAVAVRTELGLHAPDGSESLGLLAAAIRKGVEDGYVRVDDLLTGRSIPTASTSPPISIKSPTLYDAVERHLKDRGASFKVIEESRSAVRQFERYIGRKSITETTRADMRNFVIALASQTVGGKAVGSVKRPLSSGTISKRVRLLSAAIGHAKDVGIYDGDNPASGIRVSAFVATVDKSVMPDKRPFSINELNAVFQHPWFTGCVSESDTHNVGNYRLQGSEYWVPVVAVLTGCRAAELGGLKLSEIFLDDQHPHILIKPNEYRGTKKGKTRRIPILKYLIELGFAHYVARIERSGADRLFPDWTVPVRQHKGKAYYNWANGKILRSFNRTVISQSLGSVLSTQARREVTFHSFRGAFKKLMVVSNSIPVNVAHEVIGHAKSGLDERYIGSIGIEETYPFVHNCLYNGLNIPALR